MRKILSKIIISVSSILLLCAIIYSLIKITNTTNQTEKDIPADHRLILGFSQVGSESAWRSRNTESIFEAASANNIQIIFDDAQQKQENQLKAIRSFIVYQVDVIAFVPIVEDGWDKVLQEAKDAGIPVIIVDRQINTDPSLYAGFLGENSFEEGQKAATFLVNKCKNDQRESINILELSGTENSSVATERANGFRSVIKSDPKFIIMHSENGDFLRSRGKEIMDKMIFDNGGYLKYNGTDIDVVYSHNDSMTLGLLDSLKKNQISPERTIIISIDAEQKSIDALIQGNLNCVVECNPNLGPTLMKLVIDIADGKQIPKVSYTEETVFTENDDFTLYKPRGY